MTTAKKATGAKTGKGAGSKNSKAPKAEVVKANLKKAAEKSIERESKYNYPEGLDDKGKKEFRRKARAAKETFENEIAELKGKKDPASLAKKEKEYSKWQKETYNAAA